MAKASLTISSRNYSSWCLRGWLLCRFAGLDFEVEKVPLDDADARAELLLLAPSFLTPCLSYDGLQVWDTLAIGEFLNELLPGSGLLPAGQAERALCRSISGEMHSGFANLRAALPMNLKADHPGFKVWAGAQSDVDRVCAIWREALARPGEGSITARDLELDLQFLDLVRLHDCLGDPFNHFRQLQDVLAVGAAHRVQRHVIGGEAGADRGVHGVGHGALFAEQIWAA